MAALYDDLLLGAKAIGAYIGVPRRKVYYMAERELLPVIKKGRSMFARRSEIDLWFTSSRPEEA